MAIIVKAQRQIDSIALPGVRMTAAETPDSLGANVHEARAAGAQQAAGLGGQVAAMATQWERQQAMAAKEQADLVSNAKDSTFVQQAHLKLANDPDTGFVTVHGEAASALKDTVPAAWDKAIGDYAATIADPDRRARVYAMAAKEGVGVQADLDRHVYTEHEAVGESAMKANEQTAMSMAVTHAETPDQAFPALNQAAAYRIAWMTQHGAPQEAIDTYKDEFLSAGHTAIVTRLLSEGQDIKAKEYYDEVKQAGGFVGKDLLELTKSVESGSTAGEAARIVASVFPTPSNDHEPIDMAALYEKANAMAGDNQKVAEQARQGLREKKSAVDDARRERDGARNEAVWGAVLQGKSIDEIRQLPEYVGNPDIQLKVRDYLQRESEHEDARANSAEARAAGRESRAYTAEVRRENELKMNGFAKFYDLDTPESLRALTPGAIQAMLPDLGHELVGKLLGDRQQLVTGDARNATTQAAAEKKWLSSRIDANVFNEVANDAGLTYVYAKTKSATQKANTGQLLDAVNAEVGRQTAKNGGPLTVDQQRAAAQSVIDQKVLTPGYWFGENTQIAALVNKNDATKAYVPVAQIPAAHVTQAVDTLRPFLSASERGLSAADILAKHRQGIERAYAAHLMGLGADEELRRLKGGQ